MKRILFTALLIVSANIAQGMEGPYKSPGKAVIYSLLMPGMGELYADNFSTGRYFLGTEIGLWGMVAGFQSYGTWLRNDAHNFAVLNAGIDPTSKDRKFFVNVGNYNSRQEYNEAMLRNRDYGAVYWDESYDWEWSDSETRRSFRSMRIKSEQMLNAIRFIGAAIIANHVASAIMAAYSVTSYNKNVFSIHMLPLQNGFAATFQITF